MFLEILFLFKLEFDRSIAYLHCPPGSDKKVFWERVENRGISAYNIKNIFFLCANFPCFINCYRLQLNMEREGK